MKYSWLVILLLVVTSPSCYSWGYRIGNPQTEEAVRFATSTEDGGLMITGESALSDSVGGSALVLRLQASGRLLWQRKFDDRVGANFILPSADGSFLLVGGKTFQDGQSGVWVVKMNSDSTTRWERIYTSIESYGGVYAASQTADGGCILAGEAGVRVGQSLQLGAWALKLTAGGEVEWQKSYILPGGIFYSVLQTRDGGYILTGENVPDEFQSVNCWVVKMDRAGRIQWQKTILGRYVESGYAVIEKSGGGFIVAGTTSSFGRGNDDMWLVSFSSSGNILWQKTYGGRYNEEAFGILQDPDGQFVVLGETQSYGAGNRDVWLIKVDSMGNIQWQKTYGTSQEDQAAVLVPAPNGGFFIVGQVGPTGPGNHDIVVIKIDQDGNPGQTCLSVQDTLVAALNSHARTTQSRVMVGHTSLKAAAVNTPSSATHLPIIRSCN